MNKPKYLLSFPLILLAMLYLVFMLLCYIFSNKELVYPFHVISTPGMLALPVALVIIDMIAELFGYRVTRQVFWTSLIAQGVFCFVVAGLALLPDTKAIPGGIPGSDYKAVFSIMPRVYIACFIGLVISTWVNMKLISRWQFLLRGRYFWLRIIGASGIGDALFVFISTFINAYGRFPTLMIFKACIGNYLIEVIALIILSPIATIIVTLLKKNLEPQTEFEFNPFKKA